MKVSREIRAMPWPEPYQGERQDFNVTLAWPVVDGERLLVACFVRNRAKRGFAKDYGPDFRLVCSKRQNRAAALYRDKGGVSRHDLHRALKGFYAGPAYCFPEISERDERALLRWLGIRKSKNHGMPELADWTLNAVSAEQQAARDARGELRDEDVGLCPEELPPGLEEFIRRTVLPEDRVLLYERGNVRGVCFQCRRPVRAAGQRFHHCELTHCPACGAEVYAVLAGRTASRQSLWKTWSPCKRGRMGARYFCGSGCCAGIPPPRGRISLGG